MRLSYLASFISLSAIVCVGAFARVPTLVVTPTFSGNKIVLENRYTSAATAYIIETDTVIANNAEGCHAATDSLGRCVVVAIEYVDTATYAAHDVLHQIVPPAASIEMSSLGSHSNGVRNTGVIYANGNTAGQPVVVAKMVRARLATLQDIDRMIPILQAIIAKKPAPSREAVARRLHLMGERRRAELNPDYPAGGPPAVNNYRIQRRVFDALEATGQDHGRSLADDLTGDIFMF